MNIEVLKSRVAIAERKILAKEAQLADMRDAANKLEDEISDLFYNTKGELKEYHTGHGPYVRYLIRVSKAPGTVTSGGNSRVTATGYSKRAILKMFRKYVIANEEKILLSLKGILEVSKAELAEESTGDQLVDFIQGTLFDPNQL